ncbi:MAG: GIY-YIG nuclease family protein [Magnetovibrio sp.]|nr:GIY-YIG nuclease family protein [Magnetovibrio sp.]
MKKKVNGYVDRVTTTTSRYGGYWHRITIRKKIYSLFNEESVCLLEQGDLVEFFFVSSGRRQKYLKVDGLSIEILNPKEFAEHTNGFVYIMSNPSMPGLLKIGCTTRTPEERANELHQATGVPGKFTVEWSVAIEGDPFLIEKKHIHY